MLERYPKSIRWRQGLPPVFILSLVILGFLSLVLPWVRWVLLLEGLGYMLVLLAVGIQKVFKHQDWRFLAGIPLAIFCMHFSWGIGFLWSAFKAVLMKLLD
jgi:hypothetical protein